MGKSRKLRQNKKNGRKSFRNLMNKSRKMMMTPFKNRFTRKMFGGANKKWVVTLVKNEEPDSTPIVTKISVGSENSDDDHMEHLTLVDQKWVMLNKETTVVQDTPVTYAEPDTTQNTSVTYAEPDTTQNTSVTVTEPDTTHDTTVTVTEPDTTHDTNTAPEPETDTDTETNTETNTTQNTTVTNTDTPQDTHDTNTTPEPEPDTTHDTNTTPEPEPEPDTTHDTNTTPVTKSVTDPHTQFYSNKTRQNSPRKRTSKKIHPSDWRYSRMTKNPMHT